jgi:hypothetical protein
VKEESEDLRFAVETWAATEGEWTSRRPQRDQDAAINVRDRVAYIPPGDTPVRRALRLHEATHALLLREPTKGSAFRYMLEEVRTNAVAIKAGADVTSIHDEADFSQILPIDSPRKAALYWLQTVTTAAISTP